MAQEKQKGFILPIIGILLLVLVVGVGTYYLGTRNDNKVAQVQPVITSHSTPEPTMVDTENWVTYTSPAYNPFYTESQLKDEINRQKSMGNDSNQNSNLKSIQFSIGLPRDWKQGYDGNGLNGDKDTFGSGFTFTNSDREIRVGKYFAPGGNLCTKDFVGYGNNYRDIQTPSLTLRRVNAYVNQNYIPKGMVRFELCAGEGENFVENSPIGQITYTLPENYNPSDLDLMDKIISTLQIVK